MILIDNLNTGVVDQIGVRNQALAFLREHGSRNERLAYAATGTAAAPTTMH